MRLIVTYQVQDGAGAQLGGSRKMGRSGHTQDVLWGQTWRHLMDWMKDVGESEHQEDCPVLTYSVPITGDTWWQWDTMVYVVLYKKMCPKHGLGQNLLVLRNAYSSSGKKPAFWINMVKQYFWRTFKGIKTCSRKTGTYPLCCQPRVNWPFTILFFPFFPPLLILYRISLPAMKSLT